MSQPRSNLGVQFDTFSYRHAEEILNAHVTIKREVTELLNNVLQSAATRGTDSLHSRIIKDFVARGWETETPVAANQPNEQRFDLFKAPVAIEIEFSRYEFLYRDYMRFLYSYNAGAIEVGLLVIKSSAPKGQSYAPSLERVKADLAWLRGTITVPIWVIALK
jgi:restriction endonuclease BglII